MDATIIPAISTIVVALISAVASLAAAYIQVTRKEGMTTPRGIMLPGGINVFRASNPSILRLTLFVTTGVIVGGLIGYIIGLRVGTAKLASVINSQQPILYIDFESKDKLNNWSSTAISIITRSPDYAFQGSYSMAISTKGTPSDDYVLAEWNQPFSANTIIGRVFWPEQTGVNVIWAQICITGIGACQDFAVTPGQWNAFALNLYHESLRDEYQGLYLQGDIRLAEPGQTYTFYVDGIEVYTSRE